jgi:hypothetical protein
MEEDDMATAQRPVPLPPTGVRAPSAALTQARRPLPEGAAKWSTVFLDHRNMPVQHHTLVPVDEYDRRTEHRLHTCAKGHHVVDGQKVPCNYEAWLLPGTERFCPDHGREPLQPAEVEHKKPLLPWADMWRAVEASVRPGWFLAGTAAAGVAVQAGHVSPLWLLLAAPTLAAGGFAGVSRYLTDRALKSALRDAVKRGAADTRELRRTLRNDLRERRTGRRGRTIRFRAQLGALAGAEIGVWLTLAGATNPHGIIGKAVWVALPLMWAERSQPWRARVEKQRTREVPEALPVVVAADDTDPAAIADAQAWADDVAAASPALKHTSVDLSTWQADEGGRRMVVRATKGAITDETMKQALPLIAGAFGVKRASIGWIEEYEDSPRAALLMIHPNSPLNETVPGKPVDVVDVEHAVAHMGMRQDGSDLNTTLYQLEIGAPSRVIIGTKGSGKTGVVRRLLLAQLKARVLRPDGTPTRLVAPFVHDPKRGKDYGAFRRQVCGFSVDPATLHMIVDAVIREMDRRYDALATITWRDEKNRLQEGERPFDPRTMGPVISLVFDEWHENAKDQALMAKLDPFARKMRAAGIEVTFATHLATIGDTGSQGFRDMCAGGEAWLLRTTLGMNAALVTGGVLAGDPRALPRVPGFLYHAAGEGVAMKSRAAFDEPKDLYDLLYDDDNNSLIQPIEWPRETLEAFGPDFVDWMRASQERPVGSAVPAVPAALRSVSSPTSQEDLFAEDALRRILFASTEPMARTAIVDHPLWKDRFNATSTLTAVLRKGQDATPPWLLRHAVGKGAYGLTPAMRDQMAQAAAEAQDGEASAA